MEMASGDSTNQTHLGKRPAISTNYSNSSFLCSVVAIDHTNLSYRVCSQCEKSLPQTNNSSFCKYCNFNNKDNTSFTASKRLFKVLVSIATDTKVFVVVMFDRAAKVLFGCSADEFFDFEKTHPFAAVTAGNVLEGEMLKVSLSNPKNGNAQHLRVASVAPLRSGFQPVIETLRQLYRVRDSS
ncbi:hypothetical protein LIER_01234 [Lithospermum erythrorhizon]|uniref:Replication factor A C-terminal domain-containing protein n=1 Tax=Lithospermum erythrorhizon TaxID=34254 RepID=A0AAV3NL87_LITER